MLTVMVWGRRSYLPVTVTYYRRGESVNVITAEGDALSFPESTLMFLAGQAYAHCYAGPETPGVGVIVPTTGHVHHITTAGVCLSCN